MTNEVLDQRGGDWDTGQTLARGQALQQVRSSFVTAVAVQKPRDIEAVKRRLLQEARLLGEDAYFGWGSGKNAVEGPSINLAVAAARCWGNCATDLGAVQDLPDCWIFTAYFIDLETGYTRTRQFRQSKEWQIQGKFDEDRKADMRFEIGQSKAERNVVVKALPAWLINAAMEAAKEGVRQELENLSKQHGLPKVTDRLLTALAKCGVREEAVLARFAVAGRQGLTLEHLVILRGDLKAIQGGQERAETLFPPQPKDQKDDKDDKDQMDDKDSSAVPAVPSVPSVPLTEEKKAPLDHLRWQTFKNLKDLAKLLKLTPLEIEQLCSQHDAMVFEDLTETIAQEVVAKMQEELHKRGMQDPREPGSEGST
jgi:hypothetical protein